MSNTFFRDLSSTFRTDIVHSAIIRLNILPKEAPTISKATVKKTPRIDGTTIAEQKQISLYKKVT